MSIEQFRTGIALVPVSADPASPKEGQLQMSDGTHRKAGLWQYIGAAWTEIQTKGLGSLSRIHHQDFEEDDHTITVSGNNATFLGGGTLDGTEASETSSPIAGTQSYKYTLGATSTNDYVAFPVIDLEDKQKDNDLTLRLYGTYDGTSGDIEIVLYDVTNAALLSGPTDVITNPTNPDKFEVTATIPATCTQVRYGFHVATGNSGKILIIDDIELDMEVSGAGSSSAIETAYVTEKQTAGTSSGTFTSGADRTRVLNTLTGDTSFISLASNQITLDAGDYDIIAWAPAYRVGRHQAFLYNVTDSTEDLIGGSARAFDTDITGNESVIIGRISIGATKDFEIRHRCFQTFATYGFGYFVNLGSRDEIYTKVIIRKVS